MKKQALIALTALPLALASCTMAGPTDANYTFARQTAVKQVGSVYAPAGTAQVNEALGVTRTTLTLTGLAPYAIYVAHYHKLGASKPAGTTTTATTTAATTTSTASATTSMTATASTNVCSTDGPAIMESRMIGQASADGKVTLTGIVATSVISDAAYINVHHGRDFSGALADSGVICTPVKMR